MRVTSVLDPLPGADGSGFFSVSSTVVHCSPSWLQGPDPYEICFAHSVKKTNLFVKIWDGAKSITGLFAHQGSRSYAIAEIRGPVEVYGLPLERRFPLW